MPKYGSVVTRTAATDCPSCGRKLDAASSPFKPVRPKPGDCSICAYCEALLQFDRNLQLIRLDVNELTDEERERVRLAIEKLRRIRGHGPLSGRQK